MIQNRTMIIPKITKDTDKNYSPSKIRKGRDYLHYTIRTNQKQHEKVGTLKTASKLTHWSTTSGICIKIWNTETHSLHLYTR